MQKKRIIRSLCLLLCAVLLCTSLCACTETPISVSVTYVLGNGDEDITQTVFTALGIVMPPTPTRENYIFDGWYTDKALTRRYDIASALKRDTTLYAGWTFDYAAFINSASDDFLPFSVQVNAYTYVADFFSTKITSSQTGSGVIIYENETSYFILTNNHVTYLTANGNKSYKVKDAYENEYAATLHYSSAEYDLALLAITKNSSNKPLSVVTLASEVAQNAEICCAVGTPGGVRNAITFGKITDTKSITVSDTDIRSSNVTFPVFIHTAPIDHGSSGGPLLDGLGHLIGINYACEFSGDDFSEGYAIPLQRVLEFLDMTQIGIYFS